VESRAAARIWVENGLRYGLYNNAPGKILQAFRADTAPERTIVGFKMVRLTERTSTTEEALRRECGCVVERGYSTDWGEADEGIHCVAARDFDRPNHLVATVWVSGIARRMATTCFAAVGLEVMIAAREIERRVGARIFLFSCWRRCFASIVRVLTIFFTG